MPLQLIIPVNRNLVHTCVSWFPEDIDVHVLMVKLQLVSVGTVILLMSRQRLNCTGVNVKMEDPARQTMLETWFAGVDKTSKEHTAMNMFQGVESIPIQTQARSSQLSLFSFVSSLVLDSTFSSRRNNCKFN